jgi:hypothetical protein
MDAVITGFERGMDCRRPVVEMVDPRPHNCLRELLYETVQSPF